MHLQVEMQMLQLLLEVQANQRESELGV